MTTTFKDRPLKDRQSLYHSLIKQYDDRIPVIVERHPGSTLPSLERRKYLVPHNMNIVNFTNVIKGRLTLACEKSLFLYATKTGTILTPGDTLMSELYNKLRDTEDGFLYITYRDEDTMG